VSDLGSAFPPPDGSSRPELKISIVTPTLNQAQFIEEAIESVLSQDYPFVEYLVIDGGSTDGTTQILESYGERLRWLSRPGQKQAAAINEGFSRSSGHVLGWLNSDDRYEAGALSRVMGFLGGRSDVDVVYGNCDYVDASGQTLRAYRTGVPDFRRWVETVSNEIPQPSAFMRRRALESVDWLDPSLDYVMDFDLWLRMAGRGCVFSHLEAKLGALRLHEAAKSVRALEGIAEELVMVFERLLLTDSLPPRLQKRWTSSNVHYRAAQLYFWSRQDRKARAHARLAFLQAPWNLRATLVYTAFGNPARWLLERWHGNPFRGGVR
jgi:glycosyltransferase involved in cell wall biosynthesis